MKYLLICAFSLFTSYNTVNKIAQDCKVKLEAINKKYEGDCKKGYAHGFGKAWGASDYYEGKFHKGLPHGEGSYTWENGNTYVGNFSKGLMDGKGVLTLKGLSGKETIKKGFFKKGKYLGVYERPYKVISQTGIRTIKFRENSIKQNEVRITVYKDGQIITPSFTITDLNNTPVENRNGTVLTNVVFPLKRVDLSFNVDTFTYKAIFEIYKESNWEVTLSL
ncbi:hypothetical protein [Flavivirga spongiicola]|uniref:MORN repeat protein n=1 Tax=Flavivirga spongiicola TaxID=421621 RepID=A0ABU7XTV0_9FLAO|nr:hypothetical protein [Flavivirga sp. MEBiC05379]MDO5979181.1 hypothetical protein [Flavivirga sp. MEBiC05379]